MNVNQGDLVELFTFFAKMKADIDQYKNDHTVREVERSNYFLASHRLFLILNGV